MVNIDRIHVHPCLTAAWLVGGGFGLGAVIIADLALGGGLGAISWLALLAWLLPPIGVLLTIAVLRCEAVIKYSVLRIGYTCPKCSKQHVPYFRCPDCSELIEDLGATISGVWHTRCECGALVPTVDWAGRLALEKVCRHCSADLLHSELGRQSEYRIAVVGAQSSGKTNLMVTSIWRLEKHFAPYNDIEVDFGNPSEESEYRSYIGMLEAGKVMEKTVSQAVPKAFTLSLRSANGKGGLLYLYDAAGEDYADEEHLSGHPVEQYDGVLFLVDPFAEEEIRGELRNRTSQEEVDQANPAPVDANEILGRLVNVLERVHRVPVGGTFPIPIAVAVTKTDACGLNERLGIPPDRSHQRFHNMTVAAHHTERYSSRVRSFLKHEGLGMLARIIESRFPRVAYFGVSSLGRSRKDEDQSPFEPRGVLAPLLWLCYHTDALSDRDTFDRSIINTHFYLSRCLRGREGSRAFWTFSGVLAAIGLVLFILVMTVDLLPLLFCGGFLVIGFVIAYVCWYVAIIRGRFEE